MLKKWCVAAALLPLAAAGQVVCALGSGAASYRASADQRPSADALELAGRAYDAAKTICGKNCPEVVLFRNTTAANLMLIVAAQRAKIVYSPPAFKAVY